MIDFTSAHTAQQWAAFSGDRNPIHFDLDAARQLGADRLVVHGMLALMKAKQATSTWWTGKRAATAWQQFNAVFRLPALQGSALHLDLRPRADGMCFTLHADEQLCVRGQHSSAPEPLEQNEPPDTGPATCLSEPLMQDRHQVFCSLFPSISHPWIFLDALIFSAFLEEHFKAQTPLAHGFVPVQMSHRVIFNAAAIAELWPSGPPSQAQPSRLPRTLHYTVRKLEGPDEGKSRGGDGDRNRDRFGIAVLTVRTEQGPLMQTEIGLLAKRMTSMTRMPPTAHP